MRLDGKEKENSSRCQRICSGSKKSSKNRVALILNQKFGNNVLSSYPANGRLLMVSYKPINLFVTLVYFPT